MICRLEKNTWRVKKEPWMKLLRKIEAEFCVLIIQIIKNMDCFKARKQY